MIQSERPQNAPKTIKLHLLGTFQVYEEAAKVSMQLRTRKIEALLAYLAIEYDKVHSRLALATMLWPDTSEKTSLKNLRNSLARLKQHLAAPTNLVVTRQTVQLQLDMESIWVDVNRFRHLWRVVQDKREITSTQYVAYLSEAVELYQGNFLTGLTIPASEQFDEWLLWHQEMYHQQVLLMLSRLTDHYLAMGEFLLAERYARRQLSLEVWREEAHRQLMRATMAQGEKHAALQQYEQCRETLLIHLGVEPDATTQALYERILTVDHTTENMDNRTNLPASLTPFVGREQEMADLTTILTENKYRLITLTGMGGVGKTRLALEVGWRQRPFFSHGVFFISLAEQQTGDSLVVAIAEAIGFAFSGNQPLSDQLLAYLQARKMLLILDNMEHIVDDVVVNLVLTLLQSLPQLTLLVTSRRLLQVQAERVYRLQSLPYPSPEASLTEAHTYEAVDFFVHQVQRVDKDYQLTEMTLQTVIALCQLVDGLPLALNLLAARFWQWEGRTLLTAIQQNLDTISVKWRDLPTRQRSIRAVFDHSWSLLNGEQQYVLSQLTVFRGGFTQKAAGQIITGATPLILEELVEHSLLQQAHNGRYVLHALLHQFAAEKLQAQPRLWRDVAQRHALYYLADAAQYTKVLYGAYLPEARQHLQQAWANIIKSWQYSLQAETNWSQLSLALPTLRAYYDISKRFEEGVQFFSQTSMYLQPQQPGWRDDQQKASKMFLLAATLLAEAKLLVNLARYDTIADLMKQVRDLMQQAPALEIEVETYLIETDVAARQGQFDNALHLSERGLTCISKQTHPILGAELILLQVYVHSVQGQLKEALDLCQQAGLLFEQEGHLNGVGRMNATLARIFTDLGKWEQAENAYHRAHEVARLQDDKHRFVEITAHLGILYSRRGLYEKAIGCFLEALPWLQNYGSAYRLDTIFNNLGLDYFHLGQYEQAVRYNEQALQTAYLAQDVPIQCATLMNWGLLCQRQGDWETAVSYCQQATALAYKMGVKPLASYSLTTLGHAYTSLERWSEAEAAYTEALHIREAMKETPLILETKAGLALLAYAQGNTEAAHRQAMAIVPALAKVVGAEEPLWVYWVCYQILSETTMAYPVLEAAYRLLQSQAEKIENDAFKQTFLYRIPYHQKIMKQAGEVGIIKATRG